MSFAVIASATLITIPAYALTGGSVVHTANQYSYVAYLQYSINGAPPSGLCQGALIRQDVVVTAAHCVFDAAAKGRDVKPGEVSVWLGADTVQFGTTPPNGGAELYQVRTVTRDTAYNGNIERGHDLAILQLDRPAAAQFRPLPLTSPADKAAARKNRSYIAEGYMDTRTLEASAVQEVGLSIPCGLRWRATSITVHKDGVRLLGGDSGGGLTASLGGVTKLAGVLSGAPTWRFGTCPDAYTDLRSGTTSRKWLDDKLNALPAPPSNPQPTPESLPYTRTSVAGDGTQGNGESTGESISGDGTLAVFDSKANNLVTGDTNATYDVFVRNIRSGQTTRVSTTAAGDQANGSSAQGQISRNGRMVLFRSSATNLVANAPAGSILYTKDTLTGAVAVVSSTSTGVPVVGATSARFVDAQGSLVLMSVQSTDLVPGTPDARDRLYLKNMATGAVSQVSLAGDTGAVHNLGGFAVTPDGSTLAYSYRNGVDDSVARTVYLRNMATGQTKSVLTKNGESDVWSISADGSKIGIESYASDLTPVDNNGTWDAFSIDAANGAALRLSTASDGTEANGSSGGPLFTPDGTAAVFSSDATNLIPGDTNGQEDLFRKNLASGAVNLLSVPLANTQNDGFTGAGQFSDDGKVLAVRSQSSKLVPGDTNAATDTFALQFG